MKILAKITTIIYVQTLFNNSVNQLQDHCKKNDAIDLEDVRKIKPDKILISPGPKDLKFRNIFKKY